MSWVSGIRGVGTLLVVTAAALVIAVGAQAQQQPDPARVEKIVGLSCGGCHDLRPIETAALDKDAWSAVIQDMIAKGADVPDADQPILLDYLVTNHGPLPNGAGQNVLLNTCTMCHDLGRVRNGRRSRDEWMETLNEMRKEGAQLSEAEYQSVLDYLSKNFAK